jgi:hypothetical protein
MAFRLKPAAKSRRRIPTSAPWLGRAPGRRHRPKACRSALVLFVQFRVSVQALRPANTNAAPEAGPPSSARARALNQLADRFVAVYMTADVRSLAAGRIALALVLLLDLGKRWVQLGSWYTNDGLVPNHTQLWRPVFTYDFSFFFLASYAPQAIVGFVICAGAYLALLVGVYTRRAQVLSMICVLSLHGRLLIFDNGGDVVLGLLAVWTAFLPTGRVWSVDAVLGSTERNRTPSETKIVSLGVLAVLCQLAFIYFFNAVHKGGETWRDGSAVHYVLHYDRFVTSFGVWLRERMTPGMARAMTWSTLGMEWVLPWLILSPFAVARCRRAAIVLVIALHVGIGMCINLGVFMPAMIAFAPHLLHGDDWDALERWWARGARRARLAAAWTARGRTIVMRAGRLLSPGRTIRVSGPGPVVAALRAHVPLLRECTVGLFIVFASNQLLDENQAAHRVIDHHNRAPVAAAVTILNLFQGWSMFAPDVSKTDLSLSVDAVTVDGRHVDPWNEVATPRYPMPGASIPTRMDQSWLFYQYVTRLPWRPTYQTSFQEWLLRYPQRTGRREDEIVSFKVFKVEDDSPPPGEREPANPRAELIFEYSAAPAISPAGSSAATPSE